MQSLSGITKIRSKKTGVLLLLTVAILTAILLAAGLSNMRLLPGEPLPLAGILQLFSGMTLAPPRFSLPLDILRPLMACLWVLVIVSIIGFIISPEIRKEVFRRLLVYSFWIILFYAFSISVWPYLSQFTNQEATGPVESGLGDLPDSEILPAPPDFIVNPPQWIVFAVSVFLLVLLLAIVWFIWYLFSRRSNKTPLDLLTQEAQQALDDLKAGHDLKDTIMRSYFEMSQILSKERNLHRAQGMTPREFEQYLAESGLRTEHIHRLTRLFEGVRYGGKSAGQREEEEAIACLTVIVQTYGQPL